MKLGREIAHELIELRLAACRRREGQVSPLLRKDVGKAVVRLDHALYENHVFCPHDEAARHHSRANAYSVHAAPFSGQAPSRTGTLKVLSAPTPTVVRKSSIAVLIVGGGPHAFRLVTALERASLVAISTDDVAGACDSVVRDLPFVVLSLLESNREAEIKRLTAIANAVGSVVLSLDPRADDATFKSVLDKAVETARKRSGG